MPSSSNPKPLHNTMSHTPYASSPPALPNRFDPNAIPNTTFVQTDPSNFQAVVQRLNGATQDPSFPKLPVTVPARLSGKPNSSHLRPAFKLHDRRQTAKKLEITLSGGGRTVGPFLSTSAAAHVMMGSPVSPLEKLARGSPRSPTEREEEERGISEKGFYFHRSPLNTPRGRSEPPELLPLFPLHSPTTTHHSSCS